MADVFTQKRDHLGLVGGAQGKMYGELVRLDAGAANDGTSAEVATTLHRVRGASIAVVGTSTAPFINEYGNTDGDDAIRGSAASITVQWTTAPANTLYYITLYGW